MNRGSRRICLGHAGKVPNCLSALIEGHGAIEPQVPYVVMPQRFLQQAQGSQELAEDDGLGGLAVSRGNQLCGINCRACIAHSHLGWSEEHDVHNPSQAGLPKAFQIETAHAIKGQMLMQGCRWDISRT